jgi:hypothetical protein
MAIHLNHNCAIFADHPQVGCGAPTLDGEAIEMGGIIRACAKIGGNCRGIIEITVKEDDLATGKDSWAPGPTLCRGRSQWPISNAQVASFGGSGMTAYAGTERRGQALGKCARSIVPGFTPRPSQCEHF